MTLFETGSGRSCMNPQVSPYIRCADACAGVKMGVGLSAVADLSVGDRALAWEPTPGVVAYVGSSGAPLTDAAIAALHRIAERTRLLSTQQWRTTGAQTTNGV